MRKILTIAAAALAVALLLIPAAVSARSGDDDRKASSADRNRDRIPDRWERRHRLSLKVKQTRRDQDRDGLNNLGEFRAKTNPRDRDSDDDGFRDGDEHPGRVTSFTGGVLTIALKSGGSVSGRVTGDTEIECKRTLARASHDGDDDDRRDDHSGPGSGGEDRSGSGHGDHDGEHGDRDDDDDDRGDRGDDDRRDDDRRDDDRRDDRGDDDDCSVADLVPGATVHEAHLVLRDGGAVFREVELVK